MIIDAILKIDANAKVSVDAEDINKIIWHDGNPNNITKADIEAQIPVVEAEIEQAKANAETKKASGKQKLKDLGLDDAEINALIGA